MSTASTAPPLEEFSGEQVAAPLSLKELFLDSRVKFDELDSGYGGADEEQTLIAIAQFDRCAEMTRAEGITSINEEADDMKTGDLQYLLTSYFVGELHMKICGRAYGREKERLAAVRRGRVHLVAFVEACERKHLLDDFALVDWRVLSGDIDEEASGAARRRVDPRLARARKIEGYKREKEAQARRAELVKQREASQRRGIDVDEERARELVMLEINSAIQRGLDDMRVADEEIRLLEYRVALDEDVPEGDDRRGAAEATAADDRASQPLEVIHIDADGNRSAIDVPQAATIDVAAERFRDGVFRDGGSKPTMTLEEFADLEIADARARAERGRTAAAEGRGPVRKYSQLVEDGDEDDHALVDAATVKDRNWDDWCDDNPKGSAVTRHC